jgi:hypothetical protein
MTYTARTYSELCNARGTDLSKMAEEFALIDAAIDAVAAGTSAGAVAEDNVVGGVMVTHMIHIAAGALATKNITLTNKTRILKARVILEGAGVSGTTLTVGNAGTAITNAMAVSGSDQAVIEATTIDDAHFEIGAGGVLSVTTAVGATQPACLVVVEGVVVA